VRFTNGGCEEWFLFSGTISIKHADIRNALAVGVVVIAREASLFQPVAERRRSVGEEHIDGTLHLLGSVSSILFLKLPDTFVEGWSEVRKAGRLETTIGSVRDFQWDSNKETASAFEGVDVDSWSVWFIAHDIVSVVEVLWK
jgi:hypothetical protein